MVISEQYRYYWPAAGEEEGKKRFYTCGLLSIRKGQNINIDYVTIFSPIEKGNNFYIKPPCFSLMNVTYIHFR